MGERIYFVALLGFVILYALDVLLQPPNHRHPTKYRAYLAAFFLYDALMVFTLGLELPSTPTLTVVFAFALAFDALNTDIELQSALRQVGPMSRVQLRCTPLPALP